MNVCIATNSILPESGGIATFNDHLVRILSGAGHRVTLLVVDANAGVSDLDIISENEFCTQVTLRKSYALHREYFNSFFSPGSFDAPSWLAMGLSMREWLLRQQATLAFDIIEVSDYGGIGCFLTDHDLPPVVITHHGTLFEYSAINHAKKDKHYRLVVELEKMSMKHADAVFAYSPLNQQKLAVLFHRQIEMVTAPWIFSMLDKYPKSVTAPPVVIASLQKIKGGEVTAAAMKVLQDKNKSVAIDWIGGDFLTAPPNGLSMAAYLANKFSTVWNTLFNWKNEQPRETVIELLSSSKFAIVPSVYETFSFAAMEGATLGKAQVISDGAGAVYLFRHQENAMIVKSNDPVELADAIISLHDSPETCERLGNNARKMIEKTFNPESLGRERVAAYQKVIANQRSSRGISSSELFFFNKYLSKTQKNYYSLRKFAKKIIKGRA